MPQPNIVPFGKYKGQPVEVLAQDRGYMEWLLGQDWVRERYASFHTLIINNFAVPSETPDHNALQVLFLDDDFCERFMVALYGPQWKADELAEMMAEQKEELTKRLGQSYISEQRKQVLQTALAAYDEPNPGMEVSFERKFEEGGIDV